ncbi:VOC family protein [Neobacillus mesonae]|uniref:VOC family protein n=1 Tax=Neobacillus mesonae TaxID=1193713 RepID=UPI002041AA05|nr:VOC family protein [Neobacillus mesonae]MCM3569879.1 VOC family protein [Neobacillus mesonae]
MNNSRVYPRALAHIGIGVTNLDKAIEWYQKVLGFNLLYGPIDTLTDDNSLQGNIAADLVGKEIKKFRIAHMSTSNQIGIELFEFVEPRSYRHEGIEHYKTGQIGYFHICVIDPDIEGLVARIKENNGRQRSGIWEMFPESGGGYKTTYCEDPDGNIIEIYTHSHEQIYSNQKV